MVAASSFVIPKGEVSLRTFRVPTSDAFRVRMNGEEIPVYTCRISRTCRSDGITIHVLKVSAPVL